MTTDDLPSELTDPAWAALTGPHTDFVDLGPARRAGAYHRDVGFFVGLDDADDPAAWDDLAAVLGTRVGGFFRSDALHPPDGWELLGHFPAQQMVAPAGLDLPCPPEGLAIAELTEDDASDAVELARLAEPGPFQERTPRLGRFFGVREDSRLIAMAGERFRTDRTVEISAVSVHPDERRRGLGALVTAAVASAAAIRGQLAYLHVRDENEGARALYEAMGFETVRSMTVTVVRQSR